MDVYSKWPNSTGGTQDAGMWSSGESGKEWHFMQNPKLFKLPHKIGINNSYLEGLF